MKRDGRHLLTRKSPAATAAGDFPAPDGVPEIPTRREAEEDTPRRRDVPTLEAQGRADNADAVTRATFSAMGDFWTSVGVECGSVRGDREA